MRRRTVGFLTVALLAPVVGAPGHLGPRSFAADADVKAGLDAVHATEAKALLPVLRAALKGDHRRQAWYVATRLLVANPACGEASTAVRQWRPDQLQEGEAPSKAFVALRDAALKKVGNEYAQAARKLQGAGAKPVETWGLVERALAYGNRDADAVASIDAAGETWCGGWGTVKKDVLEETLGAAASSIAFVPEWDDAFLRVRCAWPEAKGARVGCLRVVTNGPAPEAFARFALVAAVEAHFVATFGTFAKEEKDAERAADQMTTLVAVPDAATLEAVAKPLAQPNPRIATPGPEKASRWYDPWRRVAVVMKGHRDNAFVPPDALLAGLAAYLDVRHHVLVPAGGRTWDAGTWALADGIGGLYEGFVPKGALGGELDVAKVWRLAVARAARDRGSAKPWEAVLEMNGTQAADEPKVDVPIAFAGAPQDAKQVTIVTAQATALVTALATRDGAKGARKFAAFLQETAKRGSAPDLDKAFGVKPGTVFRWIDAVLDAAPSR
jgi:hypothetical protein